MSKVELRKSVLRARQALTPRQVAEKSERIVRRLLALEEYRRAGTVMVYLDFRNEVSTGAIVADAMAAGKRVVVPLTDVARRRLVPSLLVNYPDDLAPGAWGILEPKPDCVRPVDPKELDLVLVPGVAFDTVGNRLGYGGGFYDRFLPLTRPDSVWVALAYELQIRPNVYPREHDCPVHILITEDRVLDFRRQ